MAYKPTASFRRVLGISDSLVDRGANVSIGSGDYGPTPPIDLRKGITLTGLGELTDNTQSSGRKTLKRLAWGRSTVSWLEGLNPRPDVVIVYGGGSAYAHRIGTWCRQNRVAPLLDAVEWYDGSHLPLGRYGPFSLENEYAMRKGFSRFAGTIAISSYLARHFNNSGCDAIIVPPTLDVLNRAWNQRTASQTPMRVVYAGSPGKKDFLDSIVRGCLIADPTGARIELVVAGPTRNSMQSLPSLADGFPNFIKVLGQIEHAETLDLVRSASYVALLRPRKRYSHAGFPTKVVESLSVGTPVICNLTTDLGKYVVPGQSGILAKDESPESFAAALQIALDVSTPKYAELRAGARRYAERGFDYRQFSDELEKLLARAVLKSS